MKTYIVKRDKIKEFFKNKLKKEYEKMIDEVIRKLLEKYLFKKEKINFSKFRAFFRSSLLKGRPPLCQMGDCPITNLDVLIASHIKPVNAINSDKQLTLEKKYIEISDPENGFLFCKNHDALFDKFLITFEKDVKNENKVKIKISEELIKDMKSLNLSKEITIDISYCNNSDSNNSKIYDYLKFHNDEFEKKQKIKKNYAI